MIYASWVIFHKEASGDIPFLIWGLHYFCVWQFSHEPFHGIAFGLLLICKNVTYVSDPEKCAKHFGTGYLCFWQTQKEEWGYFFTCIVCLFHCFFSFDLVHTKLLPCCHMTRKLFLPLVSSHILFSSFCNL